MANLSRGKPILLNENINCLYVDLEDFGHLLGSQESYRHVVSLDWDYRVVIGCGWH